MFPCTVFAFEEILYRPQSHLRQVYLETLDSNFTWACCAWGSDRALWIYFTELRGVQMVERGGICFARTLIAGHLDQAEFRAMETVLPFPQSILSGGRESDRKGTKMG